MKTEIFCAVLISLFITYCPRSSAQPMKDARHYSRADECGFRCAIKFVGAGSSGFAGGVYGFEKFKGAVPIGETVVYRGHPKLPMTATDIDNTVKKLQASKTFNSPTLIIIENTPIPADELSKKKFKKDLHRLAKKGEGISKISRISKWKQYVAKWVAAAVSALVAIIFSEDLAVNDSSELSGNELEMLDEGELKRDSKQPPSSAKEKE